MTPTETQTAIRTAIIALSEALDPQHQGEHWPDPIAWDGRPLEEQARDLIALAEAQLLDLEDYEGEAIREALATLRDAERS